MPLPCSRKPSVKICVSDQPSKTFPPAESFSSSQRSPSRPQRRFDIHATLDNYEWWASSPCLRVSPTPCRILSEELAEVMRQHLSPPNPIVRDIVPPKIQNVGNAS